MLLFNRTLPKRQLWSYFHHLLRPAKHFPEIAVITGFNTDIEFAGVVYHVQTEDKGLDTPLILTLVYVGGAILASKRSLYHDLIDAGFDPLVLGERLQRQHKLICAAIKAGRIEDLKRLSQRESEERNRETEERNSASPPVIDRASDPAPDKLRDVPASVQTDEVFPVESVTGNEVKVEREMETDAPASEQVLVLEETPFEFVRTADELPEASRADVLPLTETEIERFIPVETEDALHLSLLEEREFYAGEVVTIRIRVSRGAMDAMDARAAAPDVPVTVKILGTEFRPLILTTRSDRDGVATVHAWLPRFTKGRAAVLVRAALDGYTVELRRPIHQV